MAEQLKEQMLGHQGASPFSFALGGLLANRGRNEDKTRSVEITTVVGAKEAKKVHLDEAIQTRRAINKLVKSVKEEVAPSDPSFLEEPIYIPQCVKDPFDRLNRPLVIDVVEGTIGSLE